MGEFGDFMEIVLKLRGDQKATVRDIVDLRKYIHAQINTQSRTLGRMLENQSVHEMNIRQVMQELREQISDKGCRAPSDGNNVAAPQGQSPARSPQSSSKLTFSPTVEHCEAYSSAGSRRVS